MSKNYPSAGALVPIRKVLDEAGEALNDPSRTLLHSTLPGLLGAGAGAAAGAAAGSVILTSGAASGTVGAAAIASGLHAAGLIVGGGMLAGIAVVATPAVVLGIGGYASVAAMNRRKLDRQRRALLQEAMVKTAAIAEQQRQTAQANHDRADYLTALNAKLRDIVQNLREDLGEHAAA